LPFGGKVIVLGGDPRQILPVVEGGTRPQIIDATIVNSPLWSSIQILKLTWNMRLSSNTLDVDARLESTAFSKWLLAIGEGVTPTTVKGKRKEHG
jgi:ATP-dependent DNA helicase PIF1